MCVLFTTSILFKGSLLHSLLFILNLAVICLCSIILVLELLHISLIHTITLVFTKSRRVWIWFWIIRRIVSLIFLRVRRNNIDYTSDGLWIDNWFECLLILLFKLHFIIFSLIYIAFSSCAEIFKFQLDHVDLINVKRKCFPVDQIFDDYKLFKQKLFRRVS